jgi:outer membrane lipoprotein-sorting protein
MRPAENIEKLIKNTDIDTNAKMDQVVHDDIVRAFEQSKKSKSAVAQPSMWRIIMKSPITKLAAAAVIIAGTIIGLHWFGAGVPAYGITEALALWRNVETVHIKGWQFLHTGDDTQLEKFPFELWFDKKNGRFKNWRPWGWFGDYTTETPKYYLSISDGEYVMETSYRENYDENKIYPMVGFTKLSSFQQRLQMHTLEPFPPFIANLDQVKGFTKVGRERIKNKTVDIWQGEIMAAGKTIPHNKMKIWLSPETGEIVRIFTWKNAEEDSVRWLSSNDADTIEYNVAPPADCFETEPPEGYEPTNTKETAIEHELGEEGGVKFYGCIGFTLKDGSVIYGWHANHKPDESQGHLFADVKPGGPLPNLPAQIIELKPWPVEEEITLTGRHLTFTKKKGKFYEWGIYMSNKKMPKRDTFQAYKVILKYNGTEPRSFGGRPNLVGQELTINTEAEFDTWVRGAMAELSDDGKAPNYVTYENVLQLAEQIRSGLK